MIFNDDIKVIPGCKQQPKKLRNQNRNLNLSLQSSASKSTNRICYFVILSISSTPAVTVSVITKTLSDYFARH